METQTNTKLQNLRMKILPDGTTKISGKSVLSAKEIRMQVGCVDNTVRQRARVIGNPRFKLKRREAPPAPRNHRDNNTYDYLADLKSGFRRDTRPKEGLSSVRLSNGRGFIV